jgi:hypothetical protein
MLLRRAYARAAAPASTDRDVLPFVRSLLSRWDARDAGSPPEQPSRRVSDTLTARERAVLAMISQQAHRSNPGNLTGDGEIARQAHLFEARRQHAHRAGVSGRIAWVAVPLGHVVRPRVAVRPRSDATTICGSVRSTDRSARTGYYAQSCVSEASRSFCNTICQKQKSNRRLYIGSAAPCTDCARPCLARRVPEEHPDFRDKSCGKCRPLVRNDVAGYTCR